MKITQINENTIDLVLPLIADYQRFYNVADIDEQRNRAFFLQFARENDRGVLHLAEMDGNAIGFSTLYYCYSSALAKQVAVLNDLFVIPSKRGMGYGRALIDHAAMFAKAKGLERLQWLTADNNSTAQALYDATAAKKSAWHFYALAL